LQVHSPELPSNIGRNGGLIEFAVAGTFQFACELSMRALLLVSLTELSVHAPFMQP